MDNRWSEDAAGRGGFKLVGRSICPLAHIHASPCRPAAEFFYAGLSAAAGDVRRPPLGGMVPLRMDYDMRSETLALRFYLEFTGGGLLPEGQLLQWCHRIATLEWYYADIGILGCLV